LCILFTLFCSSIIIIQ